jgi:hypothetical protein
MSDRVYDRQDAEGVEQRQEWVEPAVARLATGSAELTVGPVDDTVDYS